MKRSLVLTVVGPDRPGVVRAVAQEVTAAGGDWLESRMATLAGTFAGVVQVAVPDDRAAALSERLRLLDAQGLRVTIEAAHDGDASAPTGHVVQLELVGHDHPGIVRDVARLLAEHRVSVEHLDTDTVSGAFSGETLFRARARLRAPTSLSTGDLRCLLEALAAELMVDVSVVPSDGQR